MKITKISGQVNNKQKFNIYIDGQYQLSLSLAQLKDMDLKVDLEISDELLTKLKAESLFTKYYQKSLDFLARRARSEREIRDYIIRKSSKVSISKKRDGSMIKIQPELNSDEAQALAGRIVEHLKQKKFLNDEDFALAWAKSKQVKNLSNRQLRQELSKKGIDLIITEDVIAKLNIEKPEEESLLVLMNKLKIKSRYQDRQRLIRYLSSKGFGYQQIVEALSQFET